MKKIGFITVVAIALLVLATGAWIADGIRAVRVTGRTRRAAHAAGRNPVHEDRQHRQAPQMPEAPDDLVVVA
jgi:hypothetical protein